VRGRGGRNKVGEGGGGRRGEEGMEEEKVEGRGGKRGSVKGTEGGGEKKWIGGKIKPAEPEEGIAWAISNPKRVALRDNTPTTTSSGGPIGRREKSPGGNDWTRLTSLVSLSAHLGWKKRKRSGKR